ncbi:hypothetical protein Emag_004823 [Eimeria magna]
MSVAASGSCLTLSARSLSFKPAMSAEGGGAALQLKVKISKEETVELPPLAPETQWLCDPADVPLPCWRSARGVGLGLGNPHTLCFMNAVLQALAYTPGLADDCLEERHRLSCYSRRSDNNAPLKNANSGCVRPGGGPPGHACASGPFCVFCKLEQQVLAIHQKGRMKGGPPDGAPFRARPGWVQNILAAYIKPFVWRAFRPGRQEDAHEFFRFLLDALMKAPATAAAVAQQQQQQQQRVKKEVRPEVALTSYFGRLFGSWLRSSVVCAECNRASVRFESAIDIPLDIGGPQTAMGGGPKFWEGGPRGGGPPQKPYTLEKALARFIAKETLSGSNAYMCQRCNKKVSATKQLQLFSTPRILVFALKRFSMSLAHGFPVPIKCHRPVSFPAHLNLLPYVAPDAVRVQKQQLQHQLQHQLQQQPLKLPGKAEKSLGSAASTTASSPSSSPAYSPTSASPVRMDVAPSPPPSAAAVSDSCSAAAAAAAPSYLYRLFAVVAHAGGSLSSGHYRAFVRAPAVASQPASQEGVTREAGTWMAIDDEAVSVVSEAAVLCRLQQEAYLLFYSKVPSLAEMQQQQQQQQQQRQRVRQQQQHDVQEAAYSVEDEEEVELSSIDSEEAGLSTSEDESSDSSSASSGSSSSSSSRDSDSLAAMLPLLRQLRKTERRRRATLSTRRRVLLAVRTQHMLRCLRETRRKPDSWPQQQRMQMEKHSQCLEQQKVVQRHQQQQQRDLKPQQPGQLKAISVMTAEMMQERKRAAASRQQQFGCSTASPWEEKADDCDEVLARGQAAEQQLFERLQTLQQPLPIKRSRHDREYDLGKMKKVKDPHCSKPVGAVALSSQGSFAALQLPEPTAAAAAAESSRFGGGFLSTPTVVRTQADSESGAFVVQQRAAFDAVQQQKGGGSQQSRRIAASMKRHKLAKQKRGPVHRKMFKGKKRKSKKHR